MLPAFYPVWAAMRGDRALAPKLFEEGYAAYDKGGFTNAWNIGRIIGLQGNCGALHGEYWRDADDDAAGPVRDRDFGCKSVGLGTTASHPAFRVEKYHRASTVGRRTAMRMDAMHGAPRARLF